MAKRNPSDMTMAVRCGDSRISRTPFASGVRYEKHPYCETLNLYSSGLVPAGRPVPTPEVFSRPLIPISR